jgi:hypothetical protein
MAIFQLGFMANLPWDPSEWSLKLVDGLNITPFFGYSIKKTTKGTRLIVRKLDPLCLGAWT